MRLVHDYQVPPSGNQVTESFLVVAVQSLSCPTSTAFKRLDRINRANDLIELSPDIVVSHQVPDGREITGREKLELLVEVGPHFLDPLDNKPLWSDD